MKTQILTVIGEKNLQPAELLNAALSANDRVKFCFTLLQMALSHAEHPDAPAISLQQERIGCGIDDPGLDDVVTEALMVGSSCRIAGAAHIVARIAEDVRVMAAPVLARDLNGVAGRLEGLLRALPPATDDLLDPRAIRAITTISQTEGDSVHRLVMDLHKQLNALQAELSQETLDGAAAYNLVEADRPLVSAFMRGINRTAKLKFAHPGLATTATRTGGQLVVQNDIGTTDAHVIVIHVKQLAVAVTYTDVHAERLVFFKDMLKSQILIWDQGREALMSATEPFYLTTGRITTANEQACQAFLEFLGSRLVFLIDWNRARKQLRGFLRKAERLALLQWAAESEIGHRGFLELGGAQLVNQAIEASAGSSMHFGDRLCQVLGNAESLEFFRFVFRTTTEGLLFGSSHALLRDRIRVTLATHFSNHVRQLLRLASEHAGLIFEIAGVVQAALEGSPEKSKKQTGRASRYEHDADRLVRDTRDAVRRRPNCAVFLRLLEAADDAADELEDAVFLSQLDTLEGKPLEPLRNMANLLVDISQEWIKALGHASQIGRAASAAETEDFLTSIDRIAGFEHDSDNAQRVVAATAIQHAKDFRQLHLFVGIADKLEGAADALKHVSLILREHVLEDVISA